jgi:hypothetical protein
LDPGCKKSGSGSRIRIRDEHPKSFCRELRNNFKDQKYFNSLMGIRDLFDPGSGIRDGKIQIRYPD